MSFIDPPVGFVLYLKNILLKILCGIVCRYTFSNWEVTYHRKTFQNFFTGFSQHLRTSNLLAKHIKNAKEWAILEHLLQCRSPITVDDSDVLRFDSNKF